jgi:hypothetical protein
MRLYLTVAVVACLAALGVSGCAQSQTCGVADYARAASSYQTPQQALQSLLAQHKQWLSETGWKLSARSANGVTFVSGNDSVDVGKNTAGQWFVGGVTACK